MNDSTYVQHHTRLHVAHILIIINFVLCFLVFYVILIHEKRYNVIEGSLYTILSLYNIIFLLLKQFDSIFF